MSLPIPLTVRLVTARADRDITERLRDLSFREIAQGGFASATLGLDAPLRLQPDEIEQYAQVFISDSRSRETVWEGRLEDPGRTAGRDGQVYDLAAVGPSAHAQDRTVPLIYADRAIEDEAWLRVDLAATLAKGDVTQLGGGGSGDTVGLRLAWDAGQSINNQHRVIAQYMRIRETGQWVARVGCDHVEGAASTVLKVEVVSRHTTAFPGTDAVLESDNWTTSTASLLQRYGNEHTDKYAAPEIRIMMTSTATSTQSYYSDLSNIHVVGSRFLSDGTEKLSGYTTTTVLASEVVADLLGRLLTRYDGANATVSTTTFPIEQLAYPDGVTPAKVLEDLLGFEPLFRWGAYETSPVTGKHRFEFVPWPTTVRYEAEIVDGYTGPGSADGLYDQVTVRWRDAAGAVRTTTRTASVAALSSAGLTRTGFLDLGSDAGGTLANAQRAGDQWLIDHGVAPNQGRLSVARPILDMMSGRMVMPWEIRAGHLIRVRGVQPRIDALNASTRDGVTVFRIASREYRASDAAATLELDSYSRSVARTLAQLSARPVFRRR